MSRSEQRTPETRSLTDSDWRPGVVRQGAQDHIGICLCTYKRPGLLAPLLEKLELQKTGEKFEFSLHVVDNDPQRSAEGPVAEFMSRSRVPVTYVSEPVQNIARARNRAIRSAEGNLLALLDDDELPVENWLLQLYLLLRSTGAAGVLGPVKPSYPPDAPAWLIKSGLCDRPSHATGTILTFLQTRTGNVLFDRRIIEKDDEPFPQERGRTGGEDIAFFRTMMARGHTFIWCEEAPVYEIVLQERYKRTYYLQKSLRIGGLSGAKTHDLGSGKWTLLVRSGCAAAAYGFLSAIGLLISQHVFMRHFTKTVYHLGRIAGGIGFVPIKERQDQ